MTTTVAQRLASGQLERVPNDQATALDRLARAEQHLATAASLAGVDNEVAYGSLYDAARKAITAHMLANGLRATARAAGAHAVVGDYGLERIPDPSGSIHQFQRIRRLRNRSEYEDFAFGRQDVDADLTYATEIVAAVRADLT